jgi:hypothetical protein
VPLIVPVKVATLPSVPFSSTQLSCVSFEIVKPTVAKIVVDHGLTITDPELAVHSSTSLVALWLVRRTVQHVSSAGQSLSIVHGGWLRTMFGAF